MDTDEEDQDQDQVEILVHISAPSRGTDDAAYRAFARAYLAYEPARKYTAEDKSSDPPEYSLRQNLEYPSRSPLRTAEDERANFQSTGGVQCVSSFAEATPVDDRTFSFKSLDASFKSVSDNMNSPKFYHLASKQSVERGNSRHQSSLPGTNEENLWQTMSDSQLPPTQSATAMTSPTKALRGHQASPPPSTLVSSPPSAAGMLRSIFQASSTPGSSRNFAQQAQSSLELPTQPRKRRRVDELGEERANSRDLQTPESTPIILQLSSIPATNSTGTHEEISGLSGPPQKRRRQFESAQNRTKPQPKSVKGKSSAVPKAAVPEKSRIAFSVCNNPDEIRPLPPKTSLSSLRVSDLITPKLAELEKERNLINKSWSEEFVTRDLRDTERGYWLVDYTTWDPALRKRSWEFLQHYVGIRGSAGWGVSCTRFPEKNEFRVYCWGRIVKHIYLLLHLIGERESKRTGATWFDGDGLPVVVVPPRPKENAGKSTLPG